MNGRRQRVRSATTLMRVLRALTPALLLATSSVRPLTAAAQTIASCDVRSFGAFGDGRTLDTRAINAAIAAPACAQSVVVLQAPGVYRAGTLRLRSHLHLLIESGATLLGGGPGSFDTAEPNRFSPWQDSGHSHWRCSMLYGANLTNLTVSGGGTIDGGAGGLQNNAPVADGEADKVFGVVSSAGIRLENLTIRRTGHFVRPFECMPMLASCQCRCALCCRFAAFFNGVRHTAFVDTDRAPAVAPAVAQFR